MGKLENKTALITGATSGIGEASARLFAEEGAKVILVGRNEERGKIIVSEIEASGGAALFYACDVTDEKAVADLKTYVETTCGKLDILFSNAGLLLTNPLEKLDTEEWHRMFAVNTDAAMYLSRAFIDLVIASRGTILINASIDGLQSNVRGRSSYMYASSKAATIKFTQQMALNYSDRIRVNCLCPGLTETNLFTNRDFSRFTETIPMRRVAKPVEIAKAALFLVSDDASYVSGAVFTVDGGASLASGNTPPPAAE
ncbi:MAG: SDR family oxidoreductase [Lachnospiraceae bacterium]|nr:SDR family oxidoreductase [Lachnospiraceae bacterium]